MVCVWECINVELGSEANIVFCLQTRQFHPTDIAEEEVSADLSLELKAVLGSDEGQEREEVVDLRETVGSLQELGDL